MIDETKLDALIDIGSSVLGIEVQDAWRPAIRLHLGISLAHADAVLGFDCPDDLDPAPVFVA